MIFHEIYGKYFETVSAILERAVAGELTQDGLAELVREHAFGESMLTIPANLKDGTWPLLRDDLSTAHASDEPAAAVDEGAVAGPAHPTLRRAGGRA